MALATALAELAGEAVRNAKLLRRLRSLSESDSLTGLANHRKLHEVLAHEQARAERYGSHFSLVMLDIDEFKLLNDTHGHPAGDTVLRRVGTLLSEQTRAADVVGRYGGDEFLLVLPETSAEEAGRLAEKLRAALREAALRHGRGRTDPDPRQLRHRRLSRRRARRQRADRPRRRQPLRLQAPRRRRRHRQRGGAVPARRRGRHLRSLRVAGDRRRQQGPLHAPPQRGGHGVRAGDLAGSWASPRRASGSCASPLCSTTSARSASPTASCASRAVSRRRSTRSSRGTPCSARRSSPPSPTSRRSAPPSPHTTSATTAAATRTAWPGRRSPCSAASWPWPTPTRR